MVLVERYHDISCGHRVAGHEGKCRFIHGHNYRVHFACRAAKLDDIGRVIDFSVIKSLLCQWLEENWDHKFLAWEHDPILTDMYRSVLEYNAEREGILLKESFVFVPFNPTAENMGLYLLHEIGPKQLEETSVELIGVRVEETRKCSAVITLP